MNFDVKVCKDERCIGIKLYKYPTDCVPGLLQFQSNVCIGEGGVEGCHSTQVLTQIAIMTKPESETRRRGSEMRVLEAADFPRSCTVSFIAFSIFSRLFFTSATCAAAFFSVF